MRAGSVREPLESTWATRELPILRSALRRLDAGEDFPSLEEIRAEIGLDVTEMRAALRALENAWPPYIEIVHARMGAHRVGGYVNAVSERTRRELGTWPSAETVWNARPTIASCCTRVTSAPRFRPETRSGP